MNTKQKARRTRIYAVRIRGQVAAYVREESSRSAQALFQRDHIETIELTTDDLIAIGRDGAEVIGRLPDVDPAQQQLV